MPTDNPVSNDQEPVPKALTDADNDTAIGCIDPEKLLQEANALALFIARRGNMLKGDVDRLAAYERLRKAIDNACDKGKYDFVTLLGAYSEVSAFTYEEHGVNGRTILDTDGQGDRKLRLKEKAPGWFYRLRKLRHRPLVIGLALMLAILMYEAVLAWGDKGGGLIKFLTDAKPFLAPLVWGALGTCVFLMKQMTDRLSEFTFEEARVRGIGTRVFLGAILALVVVELLREKTGVSLEAAVETATKTAAAAAETAKTSGTAAATEAAKTAAAAVTELVKAAKAALKTSGLSLETYIIAFLAGLGIKPVYAAIEGLVEGLAARIKPPKQLGKK